MQKSWLRTHGEKLKASFFEPYKNHDEIYAHLYEDKTSIKLIKDIFDYPPHGKVPYQRWIIYHLVDGGVKWEDIDRAKNALSRFRYCKHKLSKRDIYTYKTLHELEAAVAPFIDKQDEGKSWTKRGKELIANHRADEIYNDEDYWIVMPITPKASQHFGINTKWCISGNDESVFYSYANNNWIMMFILHKPTGDRYALVYKGIFQGDVWNQLDYTMKGEEFYSLHEKAAKILAPQMHPLSTGLIGIKPVDSVVD